MRLTCDQISGEPSQIVAANPVNEGEETSGPAPKFLRSGCDLAEPFEWCRFLFDIGVGCGCRVGRFASREVLLVGRIAILQLNAQNFCETMADSGGPIRRHVDSQTSKQVMREQFTSRGRADCTARGRSLLTSHRPVLKATSRQETAGRGLIQRK